MGPAPTRGLAAATLLALLAACSRTGESPTVGRTIAVQPSAAALCVGDTLRLAAQVSDSAGHAVAGVTVHWTSSAPNVLTVDSTGLTRAVANGGARVTASAAGARSDTVSLDVPSDLVPEFVPDSAVLGVGDTMTFGVRLRRVSAGPWPSHVPVFTPFDSAVASLSGSGLVTAKTAGRVSPGLAACGIQGGGAVDVVTPTAGNGAAYLWLSGGGQEVRARLPARLVNYARTGGGPGFQLVSAVPNPLTPSRLFLYEDTLRLAGAGSFPLDSLASTELSGNLLCAPPRPFAAYFDVNAQTITGSLKGGTVRVTTFGAKTTYTPVSGRLYFRLQGGVNGVAGVVDTLNAIYTFSAPLVDTTGVCP